MPEVIRNQLDRRLVAGGLGDLVQVAGWLADQGYPIGKSGLVTCSETGRPQAKARDDVVAAVGSGTSEARAALRLRMLELAATEVGPGDLIERAERLLAWVRCGQ
jgi:hypothetical protein